MRIRKVAIKNFRGIKTAEIDLPTHCVLVGSNNVGKTTIIEAFALLLGRDRMVRSLTEHDFFGSTPLQAERISIIATISGIPKNDPSYYPEWFSSIDRGIPKWINGENNLHSTINNEKDQLCVQVGFFARFDVEELSVETVRCFVDDQDGIDPFQQSGHYFPSKTLNDVGFYLIPASRTWDRMMSFASDLFSKVVKGSGKLPSEAILAERDRLRNPAKEIDDDIAIKELIKNINDELANIFSNEPKLKFRITATDSASTLQALIPHFTNRSSGIPTPSSKHGMGLISIQSLMLLLEMGRWRKNDGKSFCLAIEEPELHITTAQQRRLVHRLQGFCTQSIFTTHSVSVACLHSPENILFVQNDSGVVKVSPLSSQPIPLSASNNLRKLFYTFKSQTVSALMHEMVLIPEGRCDYEFITLLIGSIEQIDEWASAEKLSFGSFIGTVLTDSARLVETYETLRLCHSNVVMLVDGDSEGVKYIDDLLKLSSPPKIILNWANGFTVEDIIGWIIGDKFNEVIVQLPEIEVKSLTDFITLLKSSDRTLKGLKHDYLAYQIIISACVTIASCRKRAADVLISISKVGTGLPAGESGYFFKDEKLSNTNTSVYNLNLP
jgi:putative ATP-dependent endonuclease of the OLD family